MHVVSVNLGTRRPIAAKSGFSGIFKTPRTGPVAVGLSGLEGDTIIAVESHGGPDQAVYVYFEDDYAWWSEELGRALLPGTFGENLTLSGKISADMHIGDRLVFDDIVLEVTFPRVPCVTLAARMQDEHFVRRFMRARRPGVYCRVIKTGAIAAGQSYAHLPAPAPRVPAIELWRRYARLAD